MQHRLAWLSEWRTQAVGVLLAAGLALTAQCVLTGQPFQPPGFRQWHLSGRQQAGSSLLIAAMLCFAGVAWMPGAARSKNGPAGLAFHKTPARSNWGGVVLAVLCYLASLALYRSTGETLWVQLLWLSGVAAVVFGLRPWEAIGSEAYSLEWWEWWLVTLVTAVGFGLRYWRLTELPAHVDNDVAVMGAYSLDLMRAGQTQWIGMASSDHTWFSHQLLAWSMRLFGANHYGLVMLSVIAGTLTLPMVYLLGRELFNWRVGLIAMALLTVNYTHIHFSRILFTPKPTLIVTCAVYCLFRGWRTRRGVWFALAGVALGLGLLVYYSGRVGPVIVASSLVWAGLWDRRSVLGQWRHWALLALGLLLTFGPMLAYVAFDFDQYVGRGNKVGLFSPLVMEHSFNKYQVDTVFQVLLEQAKRAFLAFHFYGDESPHFSYSKPMVSPLTGILFALGAGLSLVRLRDLRYFVLAAWIVLTLILGGVLTADPPYWPHLAISLPAVVLLAALAIEHVLDTLTAPGHAFSGIGRLGLGVALAAALVSTGVNNWRAYTDFARDNAGPRLRISRYVNALPEGYQIRLISDDWRWNEHAFRFFNRGVPGADLTAQQL